MTINRKGSETHEVFSPPHNCVDLVDRRELFAERLPARRSGRLPSVTPVKLIWVSSVIGGRTRPQDFTAKVGSELVGRIFRHRAGPVEGTWRWTMTVLGDGIDRSLATRCAGYAKTKDEAVMLIVAGFYRAAAASAKA
jgi:hypothetical protein